MKNLGFAGYDNVMHIGTNGKMNEMCAAMGLASLVCIDEFFIPIAKITGNIKQNWLVSQA